VNWRLAVIIGLSGTATAYLGTLVNRMLDEKVLLLAFAGIMLVAGIGMFTTTKSRRGPCALATGGTDWRKCLPRAIITGLFVGFLTGLMGVGGGFVLIPALALLLGLPMSLTIGTSLVVIVFNSVTGFAGHATDLQIDWAVTAAFTGTATAASLFAARLGRGLSDRVLKRGFAVLVLVVATFVAAESLVMM